MVTFADNVRYLGANLGAEVPDILDRIAIIANCAYESANFTQLHELGKPETEGGIGISMWTGPRRHKYELFCHENGGLNPLTYVAGVHYLMHELAVDYTRQLAELRQVSGLMNKVVKWEKLYEAAGVPALAARYARAQTVAKVLEA